jgi:hypothetical protein
VAGGNDVRAGRAYVELGTRDSQLLRGLAAAMKRVNKFAKETREIGSKMFVFGSGALGGLAAIATMFDSQVFAPIITAATAMKAQIGGILGQALSPYIQGISTAITAASEWIAQNPEIVATVADLAIGFTALGGAIAFVGAVLVALTSPAAAVIGIFLGIVGAILAVTDVLGVTDTGFGDLFNSIRIGGQGLATWMGKLWSYLVEGWEHVSFVIRTAFDAIWTPLKFVAESIYEMFEPVISWLVEAFEMAFGWILNAVQAVAGLISDTIDWVIGGAAEDVSDLGEESFLGRLERRRVERDEAIAAQQARRNALDEADPNDGTAFGFDKAKAIGSLSTIAGSIRRAVLGGLSDFAAGKVSTTPTVPAAATISAVAAAAAQGAVAAERTSTSSRSVDVLGTFNADAAGRLGVGASIEQRLATAAEETAKNTRELVTEIRNGGAAFA